MRAVVQRVKYASVSIGGELVNRIDKGFMVLLGVRDDDTEKHAAAISKKIAGLRIFDDPDDKMNLSLSDVGGDILLISQFTLHADCKKGYRPSFIRAARPEKANPLYEYTASLLREALGADERVKTGVFGGDMQVELLNDGPVTIILDTDDLTVK